MDMVMDVMTSLGSGTGPIAGGKEVMETFVRRSTLTSCRGPQHGASVTCFGEGSN